MTSEPIAQELAGTPRRPNFIPGRHRGERARNVLPQNFSVVIPDYGDQLSQRQALQVVDILLRGGVAWFMSDCAYAVGADPRHFRGVAALDALLDHAGHPIPVTVADAPLAATLINFTPTVRALSEIWPNGLGIGAKPANRRAKQISDRLHATGLIVVRVSQSRVENQISAAARMAITSAAVRQDDRLVTDPDEALEIALELHEERTPRTRTVFIRDAQRGSRLRQHSTMLKVDGNQVSTLRHGSYDVSDAMKALPSNHGVNWSDAT